MKENEIIKSVENFYEVWSDGLIGEYKATVAALRNNETYSNQSSKKLIMHPTKLRSKLGEKSALQEKEYFESMGLKCKVIHVGPELLDKFSETEIKEFIIELVGDIESAYLARDESGVFHIFSSGQQVSVNYEFGIYKYLACIRFLAINKKVAT